MKKMNKTQIENTTTSKLEKIRKNINNVIYERENIEREKENKKFLGKCFKVRNCYSCAEIESDYWWLYFYINNLEDGETKALSFQKDKNGKISIEKSTWCRPRSDYIEIAKKEFDSEFEKILVELNGLKNS